MQDRPTVIELIEAVADHLTANVIPALAEPRLRFRTLVAANVLAIAGRELSLAPEQAPAEYRRLAQLLGEQEPMPDSYEEQVDAIARLERELCAQIEEGAFDDRESWTRLLHHCRQTAEEKLAITNPGYLQRTHALEEGKQKSPAR